MGNELSAASVLGQSRESLSRLTTCSDSQACLSLLLIIICFYGICFGGSQVTFLLPTVTSALVCITSRCKGFGVIFLEKRPAKHSEIIVHLQATTLSAAGEVHHLRVISGVDLGSLKKCYSSAKNDKPLALFSFLLLEMVVCLLVTWSEYMDLCL